MKKLLIITNLLTLSLWIYTSCTPNIRSLRCKDCNWFCYNYNNQPLEEMPYQAVNTVMDNYKNRWITKFNENDTRWVWFSLNRLKHMIYLIEQTGCNKCLPKSELGIRFYFIEYPDKTQLDNMNNDSKNYFANLSSDYYRKHNLLLVPTHGVLVNGKFQHIDFDIKSTRSNCRYTSIKDIIDVYAKEKTLERAKFSIFTASSGDPNEYTVMNKGGMGPPPYNEGDGLMQQTDN